LGQLRGQLLQKKPNVLLLDVQGVGYEVFIPLTSFYELPGEGSEITLKIHTHVREDALTLFGFLSQREKDFFLKLVSISGIGPKLAISILSGAQVDELAQAIASGNLARLTSIPGVGRKTANVVLGAVFDVPGIVVDTHVKRLAHRMGLTESRDPDKIEKDLEAVFPRERWRRFSDLLIYHGREVCSARKPAPARCAVFKLCPSKEI
jgi:Holliday junction DNA helicase RuvA subunit